jgi:hypothetical protein
MSVTIPALSFGSGGVVPPVVLPVLPPQPTTIVEDDERYEDRAQAPLHTYHPPFGIQPDICSVPLPRAQ